MKYVSLKVFGFLKLKVWGSLRWTGWWILASMKQLWKILSISPSLTFWGIVYRFNPHIGIYLSVLHLSLEFSTCKYKNSMKALRSTSNASLSKISITAN
jgi:hypothetical protein